MSGNDQQQAEAAVRVLSSSDLHALGLGQEQIIDAVEDAIRREAAGQVWSAPKSALTPGDGRYLMTTLSASDAPQVSVVKFVIVSPDNPAIGLPAINGSIMVHDSRTGALLTVMDAKWITAARTAGLSGVVARRLANPQSRKIGFVGAGVEARSHLDAFASLFPIREIAIFSRGAANIALLGEKARGMGLKAMVCDDPRAALADSDLVVTTVTLTTTAAPFLDANWLKPGAFATITDLAVPWRPESLSAFGCVIIDDRAQEAASPRRMVAEDLVHGDLKELVSGRVARNFDPARRSAFIFRGAAIGDFAVAALVHQQTRPALGALRDLQGAAPG